MSSFSRTCRKNKYSLSPKNVTTTGLSVAAVLIAVSGGLPYLLIGTAIGVTGISLYTGESTDKLLNRLSAYVGGYQRLFALLAVVLGISLLMHGGAAHAQLFDGAKDAAKAGIGEYIGEDEATSLIDTITFGMWALAAIGGIAVIAGGALQNIMVLVGGLTLFFGMAVLIGVLEFSDSLIFGA